MTGRTGGPDAAPPAGPVRLVLDMARCDGHGICALRCPERIALDRFGFPSVADEVITDPTVRRRAHRAVAACPERALTVVGAPPPRDGSGPAAPWPPSRRRSGAES